MFIVHELPGRLRLEIPRLYGNQRLAHNIYQRLVNTRGITKIEVNATSARVLVLYAKGQIERNLVLKLVKSVVNRTPPIHSNWVTINSTLHRHPPAINNEPVPAKKWANYPLTEIIQELESNTEQGLTRKVIAKKQELYGWNVLPSPPQPTVVDIFRNQLRNVMSQVLIGIASVSLLVGKEANAAMSVGVLLTNTTMAVLQEKRTRNSMHMLENLVAPQARVIREGQIQQLSARNLVPGDIIMLEAGDKVPADAHLIDSEQLVVEEATLTGESTPVDKGRDKQGPGKLLYMGTGVINGRGRSVVTTTGAKTEIGRIAHSVSFNNYRQTPLGNRMDELGRMLVRGGLGVSGLSLLAGLWHQESMDNILINATNLAVSVIPDGLTPIITLATAMGAMRLQKHHLAVRELPAVDTLGCMEIICCDKTGTLTQNQMSIREIYCSGHEIILDEPAAEVTNNLSPKVDQAAVQYLLQIGYLCNNATLKGQDSKGQYKAEGDSTDCALLIGALKHHRQGENQGAGFKRIKEIPFSSDNMYMAVTMQDEYKQQWSFVKGAPDVILKRCTNLHHEDQVRSITNQDQEKIFSSLEQMTNRALRVLGIAYKKLESGDEPDQNLTFLGLVGIIDPPRKEAKTFLRECSAAGVKVVMITGDHPSTAAAVAKEIGIVKEQAKVLTGDEIDHLTESQLAKAVLQADLYARTSPQHKLRLVKAFKKQGKIVTMVGDGVNDLPAIKEADLGVAMGRTGTPIAREVAPVTLVNDNIAALSEGIKEGRTVYANIRKTMRYLISTNLGDGIPIIVNALLGRPLPLNPLQLLWINLMGDPIISWALANDSQNRQIVRNRPRKLKDSLFAGGVGRKIVSRSIFLGCSALMVYSQSLASGESLALTQSKTMATLGLGRLLYLLDIRREKIGAQQRLKRNVALMGGGAFLFTSLMAAFYIPFLRRKLNTSLLLGPQWLPVMLWSGFALAADVGLNAVLDRGKQNQAKQHKLQSVKGGKTVARGKSFRNPSQTWAGAYVN